MSAGNFTWEDGLKLCQILATLLVALTGWRLSKIATRRRERKLLEIMLRELRELSPANSTTNPMIAELPWQEQVEAKASGFVHRDILSKPSSSPEFVLSLDADLAYCASQMWGACDAAAKGSAPLAGQELFESFQNYYNSTCEGALRAYCKNRSWLHRPIALSCRAKPNPDTRLSLGQFAGASVCSCIHMKAHREKLLENGRRWRALSGKPSESMAQSHQQEP